MEKLRRERNITQLRTTGAIKKPINIDLIEQIHLDIGPLLLVGDTMSARLCLIFSVEIRNKHYTNLVNDAITYQITELYC